jgi:hypothetical protein
MPDMRVKGTRSVAKFRVSAGFIVSSAPLRFFVRRSHQIAREIDTMTANVGVFGRVTSTRIDIRSCAGTT